MDSRYSPQSIGRLEALFEDQHLARSIRTRRYEPGTELKYSIRGVIPAGSGQITLAVERFVGGGFAGQVYKGKVLDLELLEGVIKGLEEGKSYALKILIPPSGMGRLFRNFIYGLSFQGPFSPQVNPDASRAGALWQKFLRRGAAVRLGREDAVVDILATLIDPRLGSCGEISEWVDGRMWRFEVDDNLDARKKDGDPAAGSPEYLAKKDFMKRLVALMHDMGAHELARQYTWGTCKSQPNALKRKNCDSDPYGGHVAVDFRAGLALLPFLPMCPADFRLILKGMARGSLVQFDRGNIPALKRFILNNNDAFSDMKEALTELEEKDGAYRDSLPDILHHHLLPLFSRRKRAAIRTGSIRSWGIRNHIDTRMETALYAQPFRAWGFYFLGLLPVFGKMLRRLLGHSDYRRHYRRLWTSPRYFLKAGRGRIAESLIRWLRAGRVSENRAAKLSRSQLRFYAHLPLSILPAGMHRFFSDRHQAARGHKARGAGGS